MKAFFEELEKGFPGPLYLAYSADPYLLYEAKLMVKKTVPASAVEFCLESFDAAGDGFSAQAAIEAVRSMPFLGGRKVVIIENLDGLRAEGLRKIQSYAGDPETQSLLFMLMNTKKEPQGFTKSSSPAMKILPLKMSSWELPIWIRKKAGEEGFRLSPDVVSYFEANFSSEPGLIASELKKLALAGKPVIGMEDVRSLMRDMSVHNAFEIARAISARNADKVFNLARQFRAQHELVMLIGALNSEFSRPGIPPAVSEKAVSLLREGDLKVKSLSGVYPVEELLAKLLKI